MKTIPILETPITEDAHSVKEPIKICMYYAHWTDPRVMRDATALAEAGHLVTVVDVVSDVTKPAEEDIHGVHFKHIFMPSYFTPTRFKLWFLVKLVIITIRGIIQLLKVQTDIYHAHVERAIPACYVAARLRNRPFIVDTPELTLTDPTYARWSRLNFLVRRLIRHMVSYSAGYITASPLYFQELSKLFGAKEMTLILNVPPYQVVAKNDRLRQHLNLGPEVRIALYQGYLQHDRQLDRFVRAATFLESSVVIMFLGSGPEEIVWELKSLIASEGVVDRVKIVSAVPYDELLEWTASANIGLTAAAPDQSLNNRLCLPNKFFEYLMAGLPVLSLQYDAIAEMIKRYDVGKVISSVAPQDIGVAINEMLADHEGLARMSSNALAVARQEFYWEKESLKLLHLYDEILSKRKAKQVI
jgi:glycosyltransferase involved in cell wall biosynthesis